MVSRTLRYPTTVHATTRSKYTLGTVPQRAIDSPNQSPPRLHKHTRRRWDETAQLATMHFGGERHRAAHLRGKASSQKNSLHRVGAQAPPPVVAVSRAHPPRDKSSVKDQNFSFPADCGQLPVRSSYPAQQVPSHYSRLHLHASPHQTSALQHPPRCSCVAIIARTLTSARVSARKNTLKCRLKQRHVNKS